ncbi:ATP-binding protein [Nostoc sp. FACHB-145]|uniref:AAA family ATPase n=1 Tax=Nostoc sp. FACHB-145 TaxID=2692836 RepID=UPI001687F214|nr:ATP-binding protein [Nostoc sp. FACHB-145]MBD2472154.1 ATP-binding protein [Nostoc sp. FACHB-145]
MKDLIEQLFTLIQLQNPIISLESPLQERQKLLFQIAFECELQNIKCYLWSLEDDQLYQLKIVLGKLTFSNVNEYQPIKDKSRQEHYFEILRFWKFTDLQGILILEGIFSWLTTNSEFLTSEWIKSALINIKLHNSNSNKTALLLGTNTSISSDIAAFVPNITHQLPSISEIRSCLKKLLPEYSDSNIDEAVIAAVGLYIADIEYALKQIITSGVFEPLKLTLGLLTYKINLLKRVYHVEFLQPGSIKVGGLELMQESFIKYKQLMTPLAQAYNLRIPKGVLLIGPPGTGKSYSAKVCSQLLGVPMLIVEWGNFRSYGNQAEFKLKKLLALVDRIDRIIFYLDDFDKGFAGDDDLGRRLAGMLLTWMQERTSNVLIIASANNLELLPPELTRCGRFDDIFKVDLPNNGERHEIFKIHLARFDQRFRHGGDAYSEEQWRRLLKETYRCVGAEIGAIVEKAAASTFCLMFGEDKNTHQYSSLPPLEITVASLLDARQNINPLAIREADKVERMRNTASLQGLPSSPIDDSVYSHGNINIFS